MSDKKEVNWNANGTLAVTGELKVICTKLHQTDVLVSPEVLCEDEAGVEWKVKRLSMKYELKPVGLPYPLPFRELNKETLSAVMLGGSTYPLWDVRGMQEPDAGYDRRGWVNGTRKISLNDLMARLDKYITAGCAHERSIDNSGFSADTRDSLEKARLSASENFKHGLRLILMNGLTEEDKEVINDD